MRISKTMRFVVVLFAIIAILVFSSIHINKSDGLNKDQYSWRIEGIAERISEKEDELRVLYTEFWSALSEQRELYMKG